MGHYNIYWVEMHYLLLSERSYCIDPKYKRKTKIMSMMDVRSSDVRAGYFIWPLFESQGEWGFQRNGYFIDMM